VAERRGDTAFPVTGVFRQLEKEHKERMCAPFWVKLRLQSLAELFGGGEVGVQVAAFILEMQNGLPPGQLGSHRHKPGPTESDSIKPNPTSEAGPAASSVEVPEAPE